MMTLDTEMAAIRIVSWIHGLWGASILCFPLIGTEMPRPFGSQEAFLTYMPPWVMASIMLGSALACRLILRAFPEKHWLVIAGVVPQQLILLWGVAWGLLLFVEALISWEFDPRGWLGLCYLTALSWFHAREIATLYARAFRAATDGA